MFGTVLYLISTAMLASWCFPGQRTSVRLAAAALTALGIPILVLVAGARLGQNPGLAMVVGSHALLWIVALYHRVRRAASPGHSILPGAFLAAVVATLTALLGPDPSKTVLVDAWAHIAWSRTLADSIGSYAPGFPAFVATLTPFGELVGAFRFSTLVLHFALAAQFLVLAGRGRIAAVLATLAYLLVPIAAIRFEIPVPELLSAVFLTGFWWILRVEGISQRMRAIALGALTLVIIVSHVSILQIAFFIGSGFAIVAGAGGARAPGRIMALGSIGAGILCASVLSPTFVALLVAPDSVPLVALQASSVQAIPVRSLMAGLGLALSGLLLLAAVGSAPHWRNVVKREAALLGGLAIAVLVLITPILLAHFSVQVPLQLFTNRLVLAAALPLSLMVVVLIDSRPARAAGRDPVPVLGIAIVAIAHLARPIGPWTHVGLALALATLAVIAHRRVRPRAWIAVTCVAFALSVAVRLWIWTPQTSPHAGWLRDTPPDIPILTNWPVTNELDAMLDSPVLDGLAGRDANLAIHRHSFTTELRDQLSWCGDHDDVGALENYLQTTGIAETYLVVDDRFMNAWHVYRNARAESVSTSQAGTDFLLRALPCATPAAERLAAMRATLQAWPCAELAFESPGATIYHVRLSSTATTQMRANTALRTGPAGGREEADRK